MMIKIKLPLGLKCTIEKTNPGIIIPGSNTEPIVSVYGEGVLLQYRLITLTEVEETYKGVLSEAEKRAIDYELEGKHNKLLTAAKIKHYVKFEQESPCYYDFETETLYGARGVKEKTGQIKGVPFRPSLNVRSFFQEMTDIPGAKINVFDILNENGFSEDSFGTIWSNFLKLDPSIKATFSRIGHGVCIYNGNAPIWQIGENVGDLELTLAKLFKSVVYRKVVASIDTKSQRLNACLLEETEPRDIISFLGLNSGIFNPYSMNVENLISKNYCSSKEELNAFYLRYTNILEGLWNQLKKNIAANIASTFSASAYYDETLTVPKQGSDLIPYAIPIQSIRWNNVLERACLSVKNVIQSTRVGIDFFTHCKAEVNVEKVLGYIAALVLICFCYLKTNSDTEEDQAIRTQYKHKLICLIQENFDYVPPNDSGGSLFNPEALQRELQRLLTLRDQLLSEGQYEHASEIEKFFDGLKLSYHDENSLLPPSMGREH